VAVDGGDGVVAEQGVTSPPGVGDVMFDVLLCLARVEGWGWDVVAQLDALVEGGHVAGLDAPAQVGLADEQDAQR
jgi:hypothetical protein